MQTAQLGEYQTGYILDCIISKYSISRLMSPFISHDVYPLTD